MANFKDHLKAEIFSDTFSRIFFSGPAGRAVAIVFALTYAFFSFAFAVVRTSFRVVLAILAWAVSAYSESTFRKRKKTLGELRRSARKFGDFLRVRKGSEWTAYEISGAGFRSGDFTLALAHHSKTGAVRIFRNSPDGTREFDQEDMRHLPSRSPGCPTIEDFPAVYRHLRTHVL